MHSCCIAVVTLVVCHLGREGTYETLFTQPEKFPEVIKEKKVVRDLLIQSLVGNFKCEIPLHHYKVSGILIFLQAIEELQRKLLDFRKQFRQTLGSPSLGYVTVSGIQVTNHMVQLPSITTCPPLTPPTPSLVPRLFLVQ